MDLDTRVKSVASREEFVAFIDALRADLTAHADQWTNRSLDDFLEALAVWLRDVGSFYYDERLTLPSTPDWKSIAEMMLAAKCYE